MGVTGDWLALLFCWMELAAVSGSVEENVTDVEEGEAAVVAMVLRIAMDEPVVAKSWEVGVGAVEERGGEWLTGIMIFG